MDIFNIADRNSDNLIAQYKLLERAYKNQNNLDILNRFTELIKDKWTISINMRPWILNNFLIAGRYKNVYELEKEREDELKKEKELKISVEQALEKHLKDYYKSRVTFDHTFEDGEKFKYGALNIGGLGLKRYGEYCVVIKRKQSEEHSSLAFIKEGSLNYVNNHVNIEQLSQDIANRECVHFLATLKHENDIESIPANEWPSMICGDESYIEAITIDDILNTHIKSVRMSKKDYQFYYYDYLYKDFISELSISEKYQLYMLLGIFKLLAKQGIKLEVIDENEN